MRIAVAGGTGVVGHHVVAALEAAGHEAVVLTRSTGVDLEAGTGLDAALEGVAAVIDTSNVLTLSRDRAVEFFTAATGNLLAAEERAGVGHHVALSIVGVDRVDFGYYEGKRRQERLVLAASVPGTVLRATQFHEFAEQTLARSRGPVAVVPRMRSQPVAAREVGAELARLAAGPAVGAAPELAGPEELEMTDMVRAVVRRRGSRRVVLPLRVPGQAGKAMAGGGLLPTGPGPRGQQTFAEWLDQR
ncbi:MAG TPA: SDR family oxidoreductase [Marmoricola sp.]|nr:SDR family oxidoreductase [Marmoricola sp.]